MSTLKNPSINWTIEDDATDNFNGSVLSMFEGQTSRGWGATGKDLFDLQRLVWNGNTPFEMKTVLAHPNGFEIEFTMPINRQNAENLKSYELKSFIYKYQALIYEPEPEN